MRLTKLDCLLRINARASFSGDLCTEIKLCAELNLAYFFNLIKYFMLFRMKFAEFFANYKI